VFDLVFALAGDGGSPGFFGAFMVPSGMLDQTSSGSASVRPRQRCSLSRSVSSMRFRSVMSWQMPMIPMMFPCPSR
jgi:hypothetical protein